MRYYFFENFVEVFKHVVRGEAPGSAGVVVDVLHLAENTPLRSMFFGAMFRVTPSFEELS